MQILVQLMLLDGDLSFGLLHGMGSECGRLVDNNQWQDACPRWMVFVPVNDDLNVCGLTAIQNTTIEEYGRGLMFAKQKVW